MQCKAIAPRLVSPFYPATPPPLNLDYTSLPFNNNDDDDNNNNKAKWTKCLEPSKATDWVV